MLPYEIQLLSQYFKQLSDTYNITLHVAGLLEYAGNKTHPLFFLSEYIVHKNPYCMYVKENHDLWNRCIASKQRIFKRLDNLQDCSMGVCHCGVAEYIMPVRCRGKTVGFLSAGYYRPQNETLEKRLRATARRYDFSLQELRRIYKNSIPAENQPTQALKVAAGLLSVLLSAMVEDAQLWPPEFLQAQRSRQWQLLQKVTEYIQIHYSGEITVDRLAKFCGCSRSTLQHLFKEMNGVSISTYLRNTRMRKARQLLQGTEQPVGEIAEAVGFHDANYFSLVFTRAHGMSPSEYRRQES